MPFIVIIVVDFDSVWSDLFILKMIKNSSLRILLQVRES